MSIIKRININDGTHIVFRIQHQVSKRIKRIKKSDKTDIQESFLNEISTRLLVTSQ